MEFLVLCVLGLAAIYYVGQCYTAAFIPVCMVVAAASMLAIAAGSFAVFVAVCALGVLALCVFIASNERT